MSLDPDDILDGILLAQMVLSFGFLAAGFLLLPWRSKAVGLHRVMLFGLALVVLNIYSMVDVTLTLEADRHWPYFARLLALDLILTVVAACIVHLGRQAAGQAPSNEQAARP
ncbi:hypothetical protein GVN21_01105 [Caulobacter sp. SLTY]|uniref:hypothetical protein n=1 Tax=Caulobacter sp. SLTY TaxID=2683262 RepID=UPI001411D949|nr:hypothetical protein [Caulobacter sp. SLTY]NBB13949.1 hypothetical protein [Caulobacter sp. SLTY]